MSFTFPASRAAALERLASFDPAAYARSRNAIDGAVSRLSPYITHGVLTLPEVLAAVASRHALAPTHKFVYELGWRAYFRHAWAHYGDAILHSLHAGPMPDEAYLPELPRDIRTGCTGVPVIDQAVRALYASGYLHNHARMWLASYVVHVRHVHWRAGADWMLAHLLDADLASNHLSWQWVAGTGSSKPYLFNAENVARFAPPSWHSAGSVIDTSYEVLTALAQGSQAPAAPAAGPGIDEPALFTRPPLDCARSPEPHIVRGRRVWLVHPWALHAPPADLAADTLCIGWWPAEHHASWPWTAQRWQFAASLMASLTTQAWHCTGPELAQALHSAQRVDTWADPHITRLLPSNAHVQAAPVLFPAVERPCTSFSQWWTRSMRGVHNLQDLPGLTDSNHETA